MFLPGTGLPAIAAHLEEGSLTVQAINESVSKGDGHDARAIESMTHTQELHSVEERLEAQVSTALRLTSVTRRSDDAVLSGSRLA